MRQVNDMSIKAPFAGQVAEHTATPGEFVKEGAAVVRLVGSNPIHVVMTVPEEIALQMKVGQSVEFNIQGETGDPHIARVAYISPAIDQKSRSLTVEALADNPDFTLRPGHFVTAKIVTNPTTKAVLLPERAVRRIGESSVVYVDNGGKARENVVRAGERLDGMINVREGIKDGDHVILEAEKAFEGGIIKVIESSDASSSATQTEAK